MEERGAFYETVGCLQDVIQNHLFQIVALLGMEPPSYRGFGAVQVEKTNIFQAMRPVNPDDVVRGQYESYRSEPGVAKDSDVETFCALRLFIDSWRWEGVPWYLRSGKFLAETAAEVLVQLKPPPQRLFQDSGPDPGHANYLRFRLSPISAIALAARVKHPGKEFVGDQHELCLVRGALRAGVALRAANSRCYERRGRTIRSRGRGGGRLVRSRAGPEKAPSRHSLQARQLGTGGGGQTDRSGWPVA